MTWFVRRNKQRSNNHQSRQRGRSHGFGLGAHRRPVFELLEKRHLLATFTVLNDADAGAGSLRDALALADASADSDIINFAASLNGAAITLTTGELSINDAVTINGLGAANLAIDAAGGSRIFYITDEVGDVTIKGLTLTAGNVSAGFGGGAISSNAFGTTTIADSIITENFAGFGGGIYSSGDLTLQNCTVSANVATAGDGGGVYTTSNLTLENSTVGGTTIGTGNTAASKGGGIWAQSVNLQTSSVSGNKATNSNGGGIYGIANVTLKNSTISANTAGSATDDRGGGIFSKEGTASLESSTVGGTAAGAGNAAAKGGGIWAPIVFLQSSTVSGNEATASRGGGIYATGNVTVKDSTVSGNTAHGNGGGIYDSNNTGNVVTLRNSTVSGNTTDGPGGGVWGHSVIVHNSTIASNTAGSGSGDIGGGVRATNSFKMTNSIVIGNMDTGTHPDLSIPSGASSFVRFSLIGDNTGLPTGSQFSVTGPGAQQSITGNIIGMPATTNAISIVQVLEVDGSGTAILKNNNSPLPATTDTIALSVGSLALDKAKNSLVLSAGTGDQRGLPFARIIGGRVDMGAFEMQPPNHDPLLANLITDKNSTVGVPFNFTFAANTFTDQDNDPLTYTATQTGGGALPGWLAFNAVSRSFTGTPTAVGTIHVHVTATDGKGGVVPFDEFDLTVTSNSSPIAANPIPDRDATVGVVFGFTFAANTFTDPDGDTLTYSATKSDGSARPAWLAFNATTRTFSGTPTAGDVGTPAIRVTANDGHGHTVFDDFILSVTTLPFSNSELPFSENFEGVVDARIKVKSPGFAITTSGPLNGTTSFQATRPTVGSYPIATVDFTNPATAGTVTNVSVNVSTLPGNGTTLWSNGGIVFDYQSPTNLKFAGVFQIINKLIIGQVVNGKVTYLAQKAFKASSNTTIPLELIIDRLTKKVILTSGATSVTHKFASLGTGTVGIGTLNANAKFDNLAINGPTSNDVQRFDGTYEGTYDGNVEGFPLPTGQVRFTVNNGTITVQQPSSGSGQVAASGSTNFQGAVALANATFTGTFSISGSGSVANGSWNVADFGVAGNGTWSATRIGSGIRLSTNGANPGDTLRVTGGTFDPSAVTFVAFADQYGHETRVLATAVTNTIVEVVVPPFINTTTFQLGAGTTAVSVVQQTASGVKKSDTVPGFAIFDLPRTEFAPGTLTLAFMNQVIKLLGIAQQNYQSIQQASGGTVDATALIEAIQAERQQFQQIVSFLQPLIDGQVQSLVVGQAHGLNVSLTSDSLTLLDRMSAAYVLDSSSITTTSLTHTLGRNTVSDHRIAASASAFALQQQLPPEQVAAQSVADMAGAVTPNFIKVLSKISAAVTVSGAVVTALEAAGLIALAPATVSAILAASAAATVTWGGLFICGALQKTTAEISGGKQEDFNDTRQFVFGKGYDLVAKGSVVASGFTPLKLFNAAVDTFLAIKDLAKPIDDKIDQNYAQINSRQVRAVLLLSPPSPPGFSFTVTQGDPNPHGTFTIQNVGAQGSFLGYVAHPDSQRKIKLYGDLVDVLEHQQSKSIDFVIDISGLSPGSTWAGGIFVDLNIPGDAGEIIPITVTVKKGSTPGISGIWLGTQSGSLGPNNIGGTLEFNLTQPGNLTQLRTLSQIGNSLSGTVKLNGTAQSIESGSVSGDRVVIKLKSGAFDWTWDGTVSGTTFSGTVSVINNADHTSGGGTFFTNKI